MRPKIVRITTVPISMDIILKGQLGFINQFFEVVGITGYDEKHFNSIVQREGIRIEAVTMARTISLGSDLRALQKLVKILKKERPQIVHTHTPKAGLLGLLAAWYTGVPVRLHTVGGMPLMGKKGIKRKILLITEKLTYRLSHKVYPNSMGLANFLAAQHLVAKHKIKVIGKGSSNGVDVNHFSVNALKLSKQALREKWDLPLNTTVFLFVGRLAKEKGIEELVIAFSNIFAQNNNCRLLLVGPYEQEYGTLSERVKQQIETHQGIIYLGRFDDVRPFYKLSDVFVFPSYREGFPNALLEACSMQMACIATDINGCNEIIDNENSGLLVAVKNRKALEEKMLSLFNAPQFREQLALSARQVVQKDFKNEHIWQCWKAEYDHWLKQGRKE